MNTSGIYIFFCPTRTYGQTFPSFFSLSRNHHFGQAVYWQTPGVKSLCKKPTSPGATGVIASRRFFARNDCQALAACHNVVKRAGKATDALRGPPLSSARLSPSSSTSRLRAVCAARRTGGDVAGAASKTLGRRGPQPTLRGPQPTLRGPQPRGPQPTRVGYIAQMAWDNSPRFRATRWLRPAAYDSALAFIH